MMSTYNVQDRPLENENDDALDRGTFVESLVCSLIRDELDENGRITARRARGYVVGLTGTWGLGKSSILNFLNLRLGSMDKVIVTLFNPWLFNGRDELMRGFFSELREAMGKSNSDIARDMVGALDKYWGAIDLAAHASAAFVDLQGAAGAATKGWTKWKDKLRAVIKKPIDRSPNQERKSLEQRLAKSSCAVVVLIDELDRVEDDEVRAVAQLIKAIGDIKGISYLVAYDPERVAEALGGGDRKRGDAYLEKIIQYPIPLRPLFENDAELLIDSALKSHGLSMDPATADHEKKIRSTLVKLITTPRDVKRLIGAYAILEAAVRGEICPYDVLGYAWIATKTPNIREKIASDIDAVVDDPSETEMLDRVTRQMNKGASRTITETLGEESRKLEPLIKILFPHFAAGSSSRPDRIARRRNLIRLLYLGNPPDMVSRAEVERIWSLVDPLELEHELAELGSRGRLREFLDRVDDLLAVLDPAQDKCFWPALAKLLQRQSDWADGPDVLRAIAEDSTASILRLGLRDVNQAYRILGIMEALIESNDLVLAPSVLRKLLFAHGLTKHASSSRERGAIGKAETQALVERELPRYRAAIENGSAIRLLPNVEAIFVVANLSCWDDALKATFLDQLQGNKALSTFASLIVPPGYGVDKATLDELAGADVIAERIAALPDEEWPKEPYLRSCLLRLRAAAMGRDPTFELDNDDMSGANESEQSDSSFH